MPKLPVTSGQKIIDALQRHGFFIVGQQGSHVRLKKRTPGTTIIAIVPMHKEVKQGTLRSILRQAKLTEEEFRRLLRN